VQEAANEVARTQPAKALELEQQSVTKLKSIGVKVVENVDTVGMAKVSDPFLEKFSNELGPHAVKIAKIIKSLQ
jgi:TRAP-type C4-dicarboxylate transport system substrate-binding protein